MATARHRAFVSHSSDYSRLANLIKRDLEGQGIEAFLAHEDIRPGADWRSELKKRLLNSDSLIVLLTEGFEERAFTNQEVGFAICMNEGQRASAQEQITIVPISPHKGRIQLGELGLLADYQIRYWPEHDDLRRQAMSTELGNELLDRVDLVAEMFIEKLEEANTFKEANKAAKLLPHLRSLTAEQVDRIVAIFNQNDQVHYAFDLIPRTQGVGNGALAKHILDLTGRKFEFVIHGIETGELSRNELREVSES